MEIRLGNRVFSPSWGMTALTAVLCVLFVILGRWQWERGNTRAAAWDRFARGAGQAVPLGSRSLSAVPQFQRVSVAGRFDEQRQFLLDNRSYEGRAGYEVLTPLVRSGGSVVLVDRGWVPFSGLRDRLPGVAIRDHDELTVTGRVAELPSAGLASGRAPPAEQTPWPKVTSFPTMGELSSAYGQALEPHILLLDSHDPDGYVRDWHPPGLEPTRHWSYAVQWWCFAVVLLFLWARLSTHRVREGA
jgi:cytochrome oxidase assembly protein ShyY1